MNSLVFSALRKLVRVPGMWSVNVPYPTGAGGLTTLTSAPRH